MTLTEFQAALHKLYQGDTATPSASDEDYSVRTALLEAAINAWASEKGVQWRELWTTRASTTTAAATISLTSVTDFQFAGGFLRIKEDGVNWSYYEIVDNAKFELWKNGTSGHKGATIIGNKKTGYTIYLTVTQTAGKSYELPYYKEPFIPSSGSDVIEMRDPWFAIYLSLSKLHELDGEGDRASLALAMADQKLAAMKYLNQRAPSYQQNYVPDRDLEIGTGGFGL